MKHVMAARAVAWQVNFEANERIRVVKLAKLQADDCRGDFAHRAAPAFALEPSRSAMRSSATPNGVVALPRLSRRSAPPSKSIVHPCWRAKLAATAASVALRWLCEPTL